MWPNWSIFIADVNNRGGLAMVAAQSGISLATLTAWYNGTRIPHWISRPGIASALGYPAGHY